MSAPARERAAAARLLTRIVVAGRTSDEALAGADVTPLTRELVLGSLRHFFSLDALVSAVLDRPLKPRDQDLRFLMIVGAYQLIHLRTPDHAALFETVEACVVLRKPWARALVNAVLHRCAARRHSLERSFEHPAWLEHALRAEYADAEVLMAASNARAPMALRINRARIEPERYLEHLAAAGLAVRAPASSPAVEAAIGFGTETRILLEATPVSRLPGHADGLVSVQDAGAQLAAAVLAPRRGDRVLDACAAPGGKAFHLIERCPDIRLTALDDHAERVATMRAEAARLHHAGVELTTGDATGLDWWDGEPVQRILLDAPCSGTGTLRRHPDIKLLRRASDIGPAAALQQRLLANLWQVLAPGGTLLYCTCSILAAENDDIVTDFLARHPDAVIEPFVLASGRATRHGWQLLPTDPDTDGFYFARMTRTSLT